MARRSTIRLLSSAKPALVGCAAAFKVEARDQFDNRWLRRPTELQLPPRCSDQRALDEP